MMKHMNAVGFFKGTSIIQEDSFKDVELPIPTPNDYEILVKIEGISVNPIDTKVRQSAKQSHGPQIIGYDAVGVVVAIGNHAHKYKIGDRIFYSGSIQKPGTYAQYHIVDERITALAPKNLTIAESAAMPLTSITACEILFEKLSLPIQKNSAIGKKILIINGAGGVGSILSQLSHWVGLKVYATASESNFDWLKENQVDVPLDYHKDLVKELHKKEVTDFDFIIILHDTETYFNLAAEFIAPFGHIVSTVGTNALLPLGILKSKAVSFDWEYMFAKTDYHYKINSQGDALTTVSHLLESKQLHSTLKTTLSTGINAKTIKQAHQLIETQKNVGKLVVLADFN